MDPTEPGLGVPVTKPRAHLSRSSQPDEGAIALLDLERQAWHSGSSSRTSSRANSPESEQDLSSSMSIYKDKMQALLGGLGTTIGNAINTALIANQEQMNKAMKAAINARHQQSRLLFQPQDGHVRACVSCFSIEFAFQNSWHPPKGHSGHSGWMSGQMHG